MFINEQNLSSGIVHEVRSFVLRPTKSFDPEDEGT